VIWNGGREGGEVAANGFDTWIAWFWCTVKEDGRVEMVRNRFRLTGNKRHLFVSERKG